MCIFILYGEYILQAHLRVGRSLQSYAIHTTSETRRKWAWMETKSKSSEADDRQKKRKIPARSLARQHKEDGGQKHKSR